jgi:hypothetical protein
MNSTTTDWNVNNITFVPSVLDGWLIYDRGCGMLLSWEKIEHVTETPNAFPPFL